MKTIIFTLVFFVTCLVSASAEKLTEEQQKAQRSVVVYLHNIQYDPSIDSNDNSVCFRRNGVLYWITFEDNTPVRYTINRKGFKVGGQDGYDRSIAVKAANELNLKYKTVKLTVESKKVNISISMYASNPQAFQDVFKKNVSLLTNVDVEFKKAYNDIKQKMDEAKRKAEEEAQRNLPPSVLKDIIGGISFRLVDINGAEVSGYDKPMRSYDAQYIQPRLEFKPVAEKQSKEYLVRLKIYRPDGKVIELPGKNYSAEDNIVISKSKKNFYIEMQEVGTSQSGFWKAGEYKVECIESGSVFYTTTFNLL